MEHLRCSLRQRLPHRVRYPERIYAHLQQKLHLGLYGKVAEARSNALHVRGKALPFLRHVGGEGIQHPDNVGGGGVQCIVKKSLEIMC